VLLSALLLAGLLGPVAAQAAPDCSKGRVISFVAHIDDDLLFMNPSIERAIDDGKCVRTVAITAGDAGEDETYWTGREAGQRAAYATMAGVANQWTFGDAGVGGRSIVMATNDANPKVSLVWMRLPDGRPNGAGYDSTGGVSLQQALGRPGDVAWCCGRLLDLYAVPAPQCAGGDDDRLQCHGDQGARLCHAPAVTTPTTTPRGGSRRLRWPTLACRIV
jgi:hypothetical protein